MNPGERGKYTGRDRVYLHVAWLAFAAFVIAWLTR